MNIVKTNKIRFKRISDSNIVGYRIKAKQLIDGEYVISLLETIDNIYTIHPIKVTTKVDYNSDLIYYINDDVFFNPQYEVNVLINNVKLSSVHVLFNPYDKKVTIKYKSIKENDVIEIEYFYDGIEFVHNTSFPTEYFIEQIIDTTSSNIGDHNILM